MTGVTRRQVLAAASVGVAASVAGCTALGDDGSGYTVEPVSVEGPDGMGCIESVDVEERTEGMFPFVRDIYSITVSLVDDYGWATVVAEFGHQVGGNEAEKTIGNGQQVASFEIGTGVPGLVRLSVMCSDASDVTGFFRVVEA